MNADNVQEVVRKNHGTAIEMVIHCKLGENWSSTVGMCSSCILGLDPLNYYASVLCLFAGLPASSWLPVRLQRPRGKKSWPPPAGLPFLWPTVNIPMHSSIAIWSILPPSHSLYCILLCVHRDTVSFLCANTRVCARGRAQHSAYLVKTTADSRFPRMHTQTTGRQAHLFSSGDESPMCDSIKSVHRTVDINNGYLFCLVFFPCAQRDCQTWE